MIATTLISRLLACADRFEAVSGSGRHQGTRTTSSMRICALGKSEVGARDRAKLWAAMSALLVVSMSAAVFELAQARYIHSTYNFSPSSPSEDQQLASRGTAYYPQQAARRQDDESEADGDEDEDDDQKAAASYRNQDDNGGDGGNAGNDNYGDNEPDGPYDESPVEQEGQADLERFFDDHLGASDRDGMDKENLPTNLVSLLSEPPHLGNLDAQPMKLPIEGLVPTASQPASVLTAVPLVPVVNPIVQPPESVAIEQGNHDPLNSLPTIQTSFIRLPDEKMIITHQVTRTSPSEPKRRPPPRPLKFSIDDDERPLDGSKSVTDANANTNTNQADSGQLLSPFTSEPHQLGLRISPTESLTNTPSSQMSPTATSSNNDIVATENDDLDRVYVTNETNKPFRIDDLGGFDPEEDFYDAAKELEVVASDEIGTRTPAGANTNRNLKRRSEQRKNHKASTSGGGDLGETASQSSNGQQEPAQAEDGRAATFGREISFNDPDTDKMYEDASETDEVTFGQDDPYQTDLEAEMRQQEYDKLIAKSQLGQRTKQPTTSDSMNVVVDNGRNKASDAQDNQNDDEDIDEDVDHDYKPEPSRRQMESMAAAAATRNGWPGPRKQGSEEEGAWVNDGADEMDIPSQSHQNSVLDKAEQRDEAERRAADEAAGDGEGDQNQGSDDGGGSSENGPTNDNNEESVRMPNADYLKNDFVDDDSGYAA